MRFFTTKNDAHILTPCHPQTFISLLPLLHLLVATLLCGIIVDSRQNQSRTRRCWKRTGSTAGANEHDSGATATELVRASRGKERSEDGASRGRESWTGLFAQQ